MCQMMGCGQYPARYRSLNGIPIKEISREELKAKLGRKDVKLVFVLGDWQYRAKHIPGSLNLHQPEQALQALNKDDEIVVYCSNAACPVSIFAYNFLVDHGFKKVYRYAGGLVDWEDAGYRLQGETVAYAGSGGHERETVGGATNPSAALRTIS